jgi:hypothetical protein
MMLWRTDEFEMMYLIYSCLDSSLVGLNQGIIYFYTLI